MKDRNRAGRPAKGEIEKRKAKIFKVSIQLFVKNGYLGTNVSEIANGAGVAIRTIQQHFGDKKALFRTVVLSQAESSVLPRPAIDPGATLATNVMRLAEYTYEIAFRPNLMGMRRLVIGESRRFPALAKESYERTYRRFHSTIRETFDELSAGGWIDDGDTSASAAMFIDLIIGAGAMYSLVDWVPPHATELDEKVDLFIRGRWESHKIKDARQHVA